MVVSNLAPKVAKMPLAETCFGALKAPATERWKQVEKHGTFFLVEYMMGVERFNIKVLGKEG